MKKVKFMLLSLALVAVVGGALAFKAKFSQTYCTTDARFVNGAYTCKDAAGDLLTCPTSFDQSIVDPNHQPGDVPFCSAVYDELNGCPNPECFEQPTSIVTD